MKILIHMGDVYPKEGPNAKRMQAFYEVFKERGHQVYILAPTYEENHTSWPDVYYCKTPPLKNKSTKNRLFNQIGYGFSSLKKSFAIGKVDVVLTTSPPALISPFGWLIAKIKRAKLIYDVRDIWPDVAWEMGSFSPNSFYSKVFAAIRNFMLKHSDLITTVSNGKVLRLEGYETKTPILNITNGLDEKFLRSADKVELIKKYHLDEKFTCVYVGNLGLAQGLGQLLEVAQKAKDACLNVQFLLFGSGVEEEKLKRIAYENQLKNVIFAGKILNEDVYTILRHAQMSFVSLVNENLKDSVPTKMFEALGAGCPVLLAAAGESTEILQECGLGRFVTPNDVEQLWKAFEEIYYHNDEILTCREQARYVICEKYSRQKAAEKLEQYLVEKLKT